MKMRKAKPNDFEVYESFITDFKYETLYRGNEVELKPQKDEDEMAVKFLLEILPIKETEFGTLAKFLKDLQKDYMRIYMCVVNKQITGFVQLGNIYGTKWKMQYLYLLPEYQTVEVLAEIVEFLQTKANMAQIDVCALGRYEDLLQKIGFTKVAPIYYRKQRVKG